MKGFRTLALSLAAAAIGVLATFDWSTIFVANPQRAGIALTVVGVLSAVLRVFTDTAVGSRE